MARDRLSELLQRSISVDSSDGSLHIEINIMNHNAQVDAILSLYTEIRLNLIQIAVNLETMNHMVQAIHTNHFNKNKMDELRNKNVRFCIQLVNKFRKLKADLPAENDYSLGARMKRTLFCGLHQSYINVWNKNEEFLQHYEQELKKNLQTHSKMINCNGTVVEIEEFLAKTPINLFAGNTLEEAEKRRKSHELMDRFHELKNLEKSIEDVHGLFLTVHTLVMEQSDIIQRVELHVQETTLYVDKGAKELEKAGVRHKKAFTKKIISFVILVALLLILVGTRIS